MPVLKDVVLCYTKIQQADFKYESKTEKEWVVDCIVDKATAKRWNKEFPKQKAKEVDTEDFEKIFKIAPPHEGEEQYVIKIRKNAQYFKDGKMMPTPDAYRPRVFVPGEDGKLVDVTKDVLIANGSRGDVSFDVVENNFGKFAQLKAVRVDHLIEYKQNGGPSFDELGEVGSLVDDFSDVPEREMSEAQRNQRESADSDDDFRDDDIPF